MTFDLEQTARDICPHCQRAWEMQRLHKKGHTLRFREDTKEWVHDFVKQSAPDTNLFEHVYCQASEMRKANG